MYPNIVMMVGGVCTTACLFSSAIFTSIVVKVSFEETSYSAVEGSSVRTILVTDKCFEGMFEVDLIPTLGSAEGMICVCIYVCTYVCMCDCG